MRQLEQDSQNGAARMGQAEQDCKGRTNRTGLPAQGCKKGRSGQDKKERTAEKTHSTVRLGLLGQDVYSRTDKTG